MDTDYIYGNPPITNPKFLFVELSRVEVQQVKNRQVSIIELRVQPLTSELADLYLYANLYHTPKSDTFWTRCRETFGFQNYEIQHALGKWGKIYLVPSEFRKQRYSSIQFVKQTDIDKKTVAELNGLAEVGAIPWEAGDRDQAITMIKEAVSQANRELEDYR